MVLATAAVLEKVDTVDGVKSALEKSPEEQYLDDLRQFFRMVDRAVASRDYTLMHRPVRAISHLRHRTTAKALVTVINGFYQRPEDRDRYLAFLGDLVDLAAEASTPSTTGKSKHKTGTVTTNNVADSFFKGSLKDNLSASGAPGSPKQFIAELDVYVHLLVLIFLIDKDRIEQALVCADDLMAKIARYNRRTVDPLAARFYYYYTVVYEKAGKLSEIRRVLLERFRSATLRMDDEGQAYILNALLRSYFKDHLISQADKLVSRITYPENAHNSQMARYHYYLGRIKAVRLQYSEAFQHLSQAARKAPTEGALGFQQTVSKWLITVQLLLGEIPPRSLFLTPALKDSLWPYYLVTYAVRSGSLVKFNSVLEQHEPQFRRDETYSLLVRLRHNVIKAGIRSVNLAYSRISIADIQQKLTLDTTEDAKYILAKMINERAIEAELMPDENILVSQEKTNVYDTREPFVAFDRRIKFCMQLRNQCLRAMRYPAHGQDEASKRASKLDDKRREEEEFAQELAENGDDEGDDYYEDFF